MGQSRALRGALASAPVVLAVLLAAAGFAGVEERDQDTPVSTTPFGASIDVTVVRLNLFAVDHDGQPLLDLRPEELEIREDGRRVEILALEPGLTQGSERGGGGDSGGGGEPADRTPWRVLVYTCTELAGRFQLPVLLRRVAEEAPRLVSLGPVDVVLADPDPWLVTEGSTQADGLRATLTSMAERKYGRTSLERIRRRFVNELEPGVGFLDLQRYRTRNEGVTSSRLSLGAARARAAAREESVIVRYHLERMAAWIQAQPPTKRGLLVWVTGGFDVRPGDFYLQYIQQMDDNLGRVLRMEEFGASTLEPDVSRVIQVALGFGWTVMPLNSSAPTTFLFGSDVDGTSKVQHFTGVSAVEVDAQEHDFEMMEPLYPLRVAAEATGGELVVSESAVGGAIERSRSAYFLSYQVDRPRDGRLHGLEVSCSRPGVTVRTARAVASGTPEGLAAERGLLLLAGRGEPGSLPVRFALVGFTEGGGKGREGRIDVHADLGTVRASLPRPDAGRLRVTLVVGIDDSAPFIHHSELALPADGSASWSQSSPIRFPDQARQAAVVVEELVTGLWGAAVAEIPPP